MVSLRLPKKTTQALLLFLFGLNLMARYPRTPHELGLDAFVYHGMTLSLVQLGWAKWIVHPFSYFGLYPLSHPSGSLFMLGSISLMTSVPIEGSVLLYDGAVVAIAVLGAFALSMEIRRDEGLALLISALFSLSPRIVTELLWELPTRTSFTVLVPVFIWLLFRWHRGRDNRWLAIVPPTLFIMMSAHRLTILMAIVLVAFIVTVIVLVIAQTLRIRFASRVLERRFRRATSIVVLSTIFGGSASLLFVGGVLGAYQKGQAGIGSGFLAQMLNLSVSLARSAGLLIPFVPLGILSVYQTRSKGLKEAFLLILLLVLIPTLSLRQYTGYYIIPFTAIFSGIGLYTVIRKLKKLNAKIAVAAVALGIALVSSQLVVAYDLRIDPFIDNTSYTHGLYVLYETDGTVVSNDGLIGSKIFAVSGHPYLPVGGATTAFQSPELLIFDYVDRTNLRIVQIPLSELSVESDSPFQLVGVQAELDWAEIMNHLPGQTTSKIQLTYHPAYLVENWDANGGYLAYGRRYDSPLVAGAHGSQYKVFEIPDQSLWYLGD